MNGQKLRPVVLLILDGWGIAPPSRGNAIYLAKTPFFDYLIKTYPAVSLRGDKNASPENNYFSLGRGLTESLSNLGLKQLKIAETERFAHLINFFSGQERRLDGEEHILIPALNHNDYISEPGMSLKPLVDKVMDYMVSDYYDFLTVNLANADAVAHLGDLGSVIKAVELIDRSMEKITETALAKNGVVFIVGSYGNAEMVINTQSERVDKNHTDNPVPFVIAGEKWEGRRVGTLDLPAADLSLVRPTGRLIDVGPTILKVMGVERSKIMNGKSLI